MFILSLHVFITLQVYSELSTHLHNTAKETSEKIIKILDYSKSLHRGNAS